MTSQPVDQKFYEAAGSGTFSERIALLARERVYADFIAALAPGPQTRIVDIGVSDVITGADNILERRYPYPANITACGLGQGDAFEAAYPLTTYQRIEAGKPLPFPDQSFDIATSNAVLEHVGSSSAQIFFVRELLRVGRKVFISIPNRYFPVEHHTGIPLLHYSSLGFRLACGLLDKRHWLEPSNLILMSKSDLERNQPSDRPTRIGYTGLRLGPFSSNLYMLVGSAT